MVIPLLALVLVSGIFFALVSFSLTGVFCGMILAGIAVGPLLVGTCLGWLLRQVLKNTRFDQRWHLPMLLSLLVPLVCVEIDRRLWTPPAVETVRTSTVVIAPVGRAWGGLMFYEQVPAEEPALFRWRWLGLPRPLSTTGAVKRVGGRTICVYDKGRLVKETTGVEDHDAGSPRRRRLAFRVVEQGFEQHSMRLVGGSFTFEPVDDTHTRVTLETTYVPHLSPRWCWRPFEQWTVHKLHGHVLNGIALEASGPTPVRQASASPAVGSREPPADLLPSSAGERR
jgi:hypothetical protein